MKRILMLIAMLALTGCAWAGTLTVTWDAPLYYDTDIVPPPNHMRLYKTQVIDKNGGEYNKGTARMKNS